MRKHFLLAACGGLVAGSIAAQQTVAPPNESAPLYHVTVIQRTTRAVNYQYRAEPTQVDFKGTVLLPEAKGRAWVESKKGRTEIDATLDHMKPSQRFGLEYLTYVLWAITPEGRPHNLGELVLSGGDKGHLKVTTALQAFAMIVTAEPYGAVRTPSDVVVAENEIRPDTAGKVESVEAKYELMPRGQYTWRVSDSLNKQLANTPKVSSAEYDALLELYEAENALGIARAAGAQQYAPNTFSKAQQLLDSAKQWQNRKGEHARVIEYAREAAQTAEDARVIAVQRQQDEKIRTAQAEANRAQAQIEAAQQAEQRAEAEAQQAKAELEQARERAEAERTARAQAEADAAAARAQAAEAAARSSADNLVRTPSAPSTGGQERQQRRALYEELNGAALVRDTPRGLVVLLPDMSFSGTALHPAASSTVARIAAIIARHPGLRVSCEGYLAADNSEAMSRQRAEAVRSVLLGHGLSSAAVTAIGYGNSRPVGPNNTPAEREENSRVEIVISGDSIGSVPFWDRTYSLTGRR